MSLGSVVSRVICLQGQWSHGSIISSIDWLQGWLSPFWIVSSVNCIQHWFFPALIVSGVICSSPLLSPQEIIYHDWFSLLLILELIVSLGPLISRVLNIDSIYNIPSFLLYMRLIVSRDSIQDLYSPEQHSYSFTLFTWDSLWSGISFGISKWKRFWMTFTSSNFDTDRFSLNCWLPQQP